MTSLFDFSDKESARPVFSPGRKLEIATALKIASELASSLHGVMVDQYSKIPHAISSVYFYYDQFRIDTERDFDEQDPYLIEEAQLAPPEAQEDAYWRRSSARITYFLSQFLYALITGEFPQEYPHLAPHIIDSLSSDTREALAQFFEIGLAFDPEDRFENIDHLINSLQWLRGNVVSPEEMIAPHSTQKFLPKMRKIGKLKTSRMRETIRRQSSITSVYEVQIWNPKFEEAFHTYIYTPAVVVVGRKDTGRVLNEEEYYKVTRVWENLEREGEVYKYRFLVEKDRCLSRRHVELVLSAHTDEVPVLKDLGSTHGVIVFADKSRNVENCTLVPSGETTPFLYPEDQYLQLANTHVRIRPKGELR